MSCQQKPFRNIFCVSIPVFPLHGNVDCICIHGSISFLPLCKTMWQHLINYTSVTYSMFDNKTEAFFNQLFCLQRSSISGIDAILPLLIIHPTALTQHIVNATTAQLWKLRPLVATQHTTMLSSHLGGIKRTESHQLHHFNFLFCFALHVLRYFNQKRKKLCFFFYEITAVAHL